MQGLVGEVVGGAAEAGAREVVHPVGVGVPRHRGPGERGGGGEGGAGGGGGPAAAGEPQQRGEEEQGGLEGGRDADEGAAGALPVGHEAAEQDEQDRDDAGLAEPEGAADREGEHQQADGDRCGEDRGAAADRLGQGAGGDQTEGDDQQQGAEGPAPAEGLLGRPGEGFEHEPAEGGAGELGGVVEGAADVQDALGAHPGVEDGQPLRAGGAQDDGDLADGEDGGEQPQSEARRAQPCLGAADRGRPESIRRSPTVLRVRHASSASRPVSPRASHARGFALAHPMGSHHPWTGTRETAASPDGPLTFVRMTIVRAVCDCPGATREGSQPATGAGRSAYRRVPADTPFPCSMQLFAYRP